MHALRVPRQAGDGLLELLLERVELGRGLGEPGLELFGDGSEASGCGVGVSLAVSVRLVGGLAGLRDNVIRLCFDCDERGDPMSTPLDGSDQVEQRRLTDIRRLGLHEVEALVRDGVGLSDRSGELLLQRLRLLVDVLARTLGALVERRRVRVVGERAVDGVERVGDDCDDAEKGVSFRLDV